jgi:RND family efflux transporter MFP subunit
VTLMAGYGKWAGLLLIAAMLAWSGAASAAPAKKDVEETPVVTVLKVHAVEVNPAAEFVGRVEAIQAVDLRARVEGYIQKLHFSEGGVVKSGALLIQLEETPYQAKLHEAKAKVALAQATLDRTARYLERLRTVRAGGVAATDMDNAISAEQIARAQLQEAQAGLELAEINLGYTSIKAPISGRIGRADYTLGNLVGPSSGALARIVQLDPIRVVYSVSENEFTDAKLKAISDPQGAKTQFVPRLKLPNGQIYALAGRMDFSDPQVDPGTGTIAVRAVFANPDGVLLPGQYVEVLIRRKKARELPVVPQSAVLEDREGLYVLVIDGGGKVQRRGITRGAPVGTGWAVESGLKAGETIIIHGLQKVRPGQTVRTVPADGNE